MTELMEWFSRLERAVTTGTAADIVDTVVYAPSILECAALDDSTRLRFLESVDRAIDRLRSPVEGDGVVDIRRLWWALNILMGVERTLVAHFVGAMAASLPAVVRRRIRDAAEYDAPNRELISTVIDALTR